VTYDFDVIEFDDDDYLEEGETAPDFCRPLVNHDYWRNVRLSSLTADGTVLLFFHTMDSAYPAIYLWQELRDRQWHERDDVTVVGITISPPYTHHRFLHQRDVPYQLYSDPQNTVAAEYGVVHSLDGMHGLSEPRMSAYHIDEEMTIQYAWVADEWPELPDYDAIERKVLES